MVGVIGTLRRWRRRCATILAAEVWPHFANVIGSLRSNRQTVCLWPSADVPLSSRVALFCHFDRSGTIRADTWSYLEGLREAGFSVVVVSNAGRLRPEAIERLRTICAGISVRRNVGYDFGAWQDAMRTLRLPRANTAMLALVNDSLYGPLRSMRPLLAGIDLRTADAWGATDSWQFRYHLQSYFIVVGEPVLRSQAWRNFWAAVKPVPSKHWIVQHYEVGLTQILVRAGFKCRAVWPYIDLLGRVPCLDGRDPDQPRPAVADPMIQSRRDHALRIRHAAARRVPLNPTSELWRQLLNAGFPFIKRELLRDNPTDVRDLADWRSVVEQELQASPAEIEADLRRTLRNGTP